MRIQSDMFCAMCRTAIEPGAAYFRCSVSSCNSGKFKLRFCSVPCWEAHLPTARHRNASYTEEKAPEATADHPTHSHHA